MGSHGFHGSKPPPSRNPPELPELPVVALAPEVELADVPPVVEDELAADESVEPDPNELAVVAVDDVDAAVGPLLDAAELDLEVPRDEDAAVVAVDSDGDPASRRSEATFSGWILNVG